LKENIYELFKKLLREKNISEIALNLNISKGTIKRWLLLESVPPQYFIDLKRELGEKIDLSELSFREKDQFFTTEKVVDECMNIFNYTMDKFNINLDEYIYIEPSAGNGVFLNRFPENRRIGLDIEPRNKEIIEQDFLKWIPDKKGNFLIIGNPPFGLRGQTALKFLNHSQTFSEFVCFILPQLFSSDGKGSPLNRVEGYNLISSTKINNSFVFPDGEPIKVNAVFQIWSKNISLDIKKDNEIDYVKIYSLSDGGTASTTRNKNMLDKCDYYIPATCFGKENMKLYKTFEKLPGRRGYGIKVLDIKAKEVIENIEWSNEGFLSTNSAINIRTSLIKKAIGSRIKC